MNRWIVVLGALALLARVEQANASVYIDPEFDPGGGSTAPLELPVQYQFMTSWDGIGWSAEQKDSARAAFDYLSSFFVDQPALEELPSPDDFTIRWAGKDFFRNWGADPDLKLEGVLGVATKKSYYEPKNPPWLQEKDAQGNQKYPLGEIYLNTEFKWHFNPFTLPEEGNPDDLNDPSTWTDGEFDFWSILLHESIHMLCVIGHASDPNEVMYRSFSDGERRWQLKESDLNMLRNAGYKIIPEPSTFVIWSLLGTLGVVIGWRRRTRVVERV